MSKAKTHSKQDLFLVDQAALEKIQSDFMQAFNHLQQQAQQGEFQPLRNRRFRSDAWQTNPVANMNAQLWSLYAETLERLPSALKAPDLVKDRIGFALMQWVEAICPANYLLTNPEAINKAIETQGQSLIQGAQNLLTDIQKGRMLQTDESGFKVGENVACTPGSVVYQNEVFQLIQYQPTTPQVHQKPLLVVPPNINKYYILDLQPENSFVKYALDQGIAVYLISWRNPTLQDDDGILNATWGDYLSHGILNAIEAVQNISGEQQINTLGFCVGGTMLASALSLAQAQGQNPANSITLLTSMLDFYDVGPLGVFVDELSALVREWNLSTTKLMSGSELATTFSFLRPSELVWNYVSSNYLQGKTPPAFDILYWNADSTNLPGPFFSWYFRNMYLENNLRVPGKTQIDGHAIDLSQLQVPAYLYASIDDHIVPWRTAYASTQVLAHVERFVLGASGHIAGVINPPVHNRRHYWANDQKGSPDFPVAADTWLENASKHSGSWWPDWINWLQSHSGELINAPAQLGNNEYPEIQAAPGDYVKVRTVA